MVACNNTLENEGISELPLWNGHDFHHLGLLLAAIFAAIATLLSLYLIAQHSLHYLKPWEQRHIIRISLLIPVYGIVSALSYVYYRHAIYYDVLEGCYEAFAIAAFFTLLCYYVAPNLHDQKDYFRGLKPKNWFWRFNGLQYCFGKSFRLALKGRWREAADYGENYGPFRKPRSGLTWFNIIWAGVFQYCVVRVFFTIVSVIAQANDVYCEDSLSPAFAHVWVEVFEAVSVTIAMFCLIQFYIQMRDDLAEHKPFLKILCIKLVIFFSFWQTIVISFISSSSGPLRPTKYVAYQDIKVGIPAMLICIEMAIFAVMYLFAFPWKPYSIKKSYSDPLNEPGSGHSGDALRYQGGPLGLLALADAFNPWDIIKAIARGIRFAVVGYKHREDDVSYRGSFKPGEEASSAYAGPVYSGIGENATELRPSVDMDAHHHPAGRAPDHTDDRAGLLSYPSAMSRGHTRASLSQLSFDEDDEDDGNSHDDGVASLDFGARPAPTATTASENASSSTPYPPSSFGPSAPFDAADTSYHPGFGPGHVAAAGPSGNAAPRAAPYRGATASPLHPALRRSDDDDDDDADAEGQARGEVEGGAPNAPWNFFAGATADDGRVPRAR